MTRRRGRTWKRWCGFVDGKPDAVARSQIVDDGSKEGRDINQYGAALFTSRRMALKGYGDVRPVYITESPPARKGEKP